MPSNFLRGSAVAALLALSSTVRPALADTKAECAKAYEASQEQRSSGKLRAARESLVTCSQSACPSFIKKDCSKWLADVEGAIPTVVFSARAGDEDLSDVKVLLGDQTLAETLDGKAVPMDPGTHTFVFESAKHGSKELKFVVKEGKKAQIIELSFEASKKTGGGGGDADPGGGDTGGGDTGGTKISTEDAQGSKALAFVLMGVGVVGVGGFAYFGLTGKSDENKLACAEFKTCSDEDLDPVKKKYLYADISLGVGLVSLGVGTYLLLSSGGKREAPVEQAKRFRVDVAPQRGGGYATLSGHF
jgi:hypothetical protein